jgi:hypothetical protein
MALPTSGNLSLSQVRAEFGAPTTTPLSAFLRGGAWVPDTPANAGVPTALPINLRSLLGASALITHSVQAPQITGFSISPTQAQGSSTAVVSDGIGPFTFAWVWLSGGGGITLTGTATATVTATRTSTSPGSSGGTLRVTATDTGNANATAIADVLVTLEVG